MSRPGINWLPIAATVIVVAAIVAGLVVSGSPLTQRELRFDERRVTDLNTLSDSLSRRYIDSGSLPDSLEPLVDGRILSELPTDPVSGDRYGYEATGRGRFRLCADFARADSVAMRGSFWAHPPGRHCFDFDFSALRLD